MKNFISNFIGIILISVSTYLYLVNNLETIKFSIVVTIGFACFYFENKVIKIYLKKALNKILN